MTGLVGVQNTEYDVGSSATEAKVLGGGTDAVGLPQDALEGKEDGDGTGASKKSTPIRGAAQDDDDDEAVTKDGSRRLQVRCDE